MKANELRLGNYVNVPKDGQCPFRIDSFEWLLLLGSTGKVGMIYEPGTHPLTWYLDNLTPIPLTEEWLIKFGFEEDNETYTWSLLVSLEKVDYCFELDVFANREGIWYHGVEIKYVHQLQNLYFALTGTELTIN